MSIHIRHFFLKILLGVLQGFVLLKRLFLFCFFGVGRFFRAILRFFVRIFGVSFYQTFLWIRKRTRVFYLPAKSGFFFFLTHRSTIHVVLFCLLFVTVWRNIDETSEVRAENFGQQSLLFRLVSPDSVSTVEEIEVTPFVSSGSPVYYKDPVRSLALLDIDDHYLGSPTVTPETGTVSSSPVVSAKRSSIEVYTIQDGDTLSSISQKFGLSISSILWENQLTLRSKIKPGQTLLILPADGVTYTIRRGDTLGKIALLYRSDVDKITAYNPSSVIEPLQVGKKIFIPDGQPVAIAAPVRPPVASVGSIFTQPSPKDSVAATTDGASNEIGNWLWPIEWHVVTQPFGWKHTGVDLDGDYTTHSFAAADGVVIYSGWRNGYGYTVEIDHGNGLVTRYGHHSKLYVKTGDVVKQGDLLAQTGSTGRSTGTHLHFEVIKNKKFQNPLNYLRTKGLKITYLRV